MVCLFLTIVPVLLSSARRRSVHAVRAPDWRVRAAGQGGVRRVGHALALTWLLLALLWAPALGRMHQAGHAPGAVAHAAPHLHDREHEHEHGGWLDHLWAHPAEGAGVDCLLLDQTALGDVLYAPPLALPAVVPAPPPTLHRVCGPSGQRLAQFQARGPPEHQMPLRAKVADTAHTKATAAFAVA